jgi:hypothetical protein
MSVGLPEVEVEAGALVPYRPPKSSLVLSAIRAFSVFPIDGASMWIIDVAHRGLSERGDTSSIGSVASPIPLSSLAYGDLAWRRRIRDMRRGVVLERAANGYL